MRCLSTLSGASSAAVERFDALIDDLYYYRLGVQDRLDALLQEFPEFVLAHVLKGYSLMTDGTLDAHPKARAHLLRAEALPAMIQILMAEETPLRLILVDMMSEIDGKAATIGVAKRAVYDLSPEVRAAAGAKVDDETLRVFLNIEAQDLRGLHWEQLCARFDRGWDYLLLNQQTPFSLYLPSQIERRFAPIGRRDLKALLLVAGPQDMGADYGLEPFDVAATVAGLQSALGEIPSILLASLPGRVPGGSRPRYRGIHLRGRPAPDDSRARPPSLWRNGSQQS